MREAYEPYLTNYAPAVEKTRERIPLDKFNWRLETPEDKQDFPGVLNGNGTWEEVEIPHFGPPVGRATATT